jgi:hypothetical protein
MPRTLGVFHELHGTADFLWNQCEGPLGAHADLLVRSGDRRADDVLIMNWPVPPGGSRRAGGVKRYFYKALRRSTTRLRVGHGYRWLARDPERTYALFYEPPTLVDDWLFEFTRAHCARIYAPDPRATHPIALPAMWTFEDDLHALRALPPPSKTVPLVAVNSGRPAGKGLTRGHLDRLAFFQRIRDAGLPFEIFGRGLPGSLGGRGTLASKANVLRPARFALVVENYAGGEQYVTEKLWDALLCWCLPIYHGSRAADRMIPADSFLRLPDVGERGFGVLREALAAPELWEQRLPAIAEARRRALGELRLVEWIRCELDAGDGVPGGANQSPHAAAAPPAAPQSASP